MPKNDQMPDPDRILRALKDFQRRTVEYVFQRFYADADRTDRFLVADEVGLGKTLVARGLIAKTVDYLWDKVERIDIVYICSNADIARQNIARLHIGEDHDFTPPDRLTLLPLHLHEMQMGRRLNFVALTPGTSFDLKSSSGKARERALLYRAMREPWELGDRAAAINTLRCDMAAKNFKPLCQDVMDEKAAEDILKAFRKRLSDHDQTLAAKSGPTLRQRFDKLCEVYSRSDSQGTSESYRERDKVVGELRSLMARTCLDWLQPDLIIMDEFQRFKHLMDESDPSGELAKELFDYSDHASSARVLLLSATPYKMYTLPQEETEDNHYADFFDTLGFLLKGREKTAHIASLLDSFAREVHCLPGRDAGRLLEIKSELESALCRVITRTERLASTADRNGMLKEVPPSGSGPEIQEIRHYLDHARVSSKLDTGSVMEYWKSAPYLLNFMEEYRLKARFREQTGSGTDPEVRQILLDSPGLLLSHTDLKRYRAIDPSNSRLRGLMNDVVGNGAWKLLWIPPALPYYRLSDEYGSEGAAAFTKRLVFSCWHVVPRVIAALMSYEAERLCTILADKTARNTQEERRKRRGLLRFAYSEGQPAGMPVLGLIYPATTLSEVTDPLRLAATCGTQAGCAPPFDAVFARARSQVSSLLDEIPVKWTTGGARDEIWYWAAPILMDWCRRPAEVRAWFAQDDLSSLWTGLQQGNDGDRENRWHEHVEHARGLLRDAETGSLRLGRQPEDLADTLTFLGLAGPGACSWRSLQRLGCRAAQVPSRNWAGRMAHAFLTLFNLPESMSLIRGSREEGPGNPPYWEQVLRYAASGCLQAVLDEYVHILRESLGRIDSAPDRTLVDITAAVTTALRLRTSRVGYDHVLAKPRRHVKLVPQSMRVRFAMRFGKLDAEDGGEPTREDHVRAAFNSPFWPFVLATTSIGQEGLDFHQYCHALVHWNLPTNPVDIEQREGRIHRYKGHAVRKNLAKHYGLSVSPDADPWAQLFRRAREEFALGKNEIVPFWVFPVAGGACIERHVPAMPASGDEYRYAELKRAVSLYRMAFGQVRQEDFLEFLKSRLPDSDIECLSDQLLLNLEPPR